MPKKKFVLDIAIFVSIILIIGFAVVQAKDLGILNSKDNSCAEGSCEKRELVWVQGAGSEDYTFLTNPNTDCKDAAKKQPIGIDKSKRVTNEAINKCKDKIFELQTQFHCDAPCTKKTSTEQACSINTGPKLEDVHECGNFGGQTKCCGKLVATAIGSTLNQCISPTKKDKPLGEADPAGGSNNQISP